MSKLFVCLILSLFIINNVTAQQCAADEYPDQTCILCSTATTGYTATDYSTNAGDTCTLSSATTISTYNCAIGFSKASTGICTVCNDGAMACSATQVATECFESQAEITIASALRCVNCAGTSTVSGYTFSGGDALFETCSAAIDGTTTTQINITALTCIEGYELVDDACVACTQYTVTGIANVASATLSGNVLTIVDCDIGYVKATVGTVESCVACGNNFATCAVNAGTTTLATDQSTAAWTCLDGYSNSATSGNKVCSPCNASALSITSYKTCVFSAGTTVDTVAVGNVASFSCFEGAQIDDTTPFACFECGSGTGYATCVVTSGAYASSTADKSTWGCKSGYSASTTGQSLVCTACGGNWATCGFSSGTTVNSVTTGVEFTCLDGYYKDADGVCQDIAAGWTVSGLLDAEATECTITNGVPTDFTACNGGFGLQTTTASPPVKSCVACGLNASACTVSADGTIVTITECDGGFFVATANPVSATAPKVCTACIAACSSCDGATADDCLSCASTYGSQCNSCTDLDANCTSCNAAECFTCATGYTASGVTCTLTPVTPGGGGSGGAGTTTTTTGELLKPILYTLVILVSIFYAI